MDIVKVHLWDYSSYANQVQKTVVIYTVSSIMSSVSIAHNLSYILYRLIILSITLYNLVIEVGTSTNFHNVEIISYVQF